MAFWPTLSGEWLTCCCCCCCFAERLSVYFLLKYWKCLWGVTFLVTKVPEGLYVSPRDRGRPFPQIQAGPFTSERLREAYRVLFLQWRVLMLPLVRTTLPNPNIQAFNVSGGVGRVWTSGHGHGAVSKWLEECSSNVFDVGWYCDFKSLATLIVDADREYGFHFAFLPCHWQWIRSTFALQLCVLFRRKISVPKVVVGKRKLYPILQNHP